MEKKSNFTFTWSIENFSSIPLIVPFESPRFKWKSLSETERYLVVAEKKSSEDSPPRTTHDNSREECAVPKERRMTITLKRFETELEPARFASTLSVDTTDQSPVTNESVFVDIPEDEETPDPMIILNLDVLFKNRAVYLPDDVLTVRCCIYPELLSGSSINSVPKTDKPDCYEPNQCSGRTRFQREQRVIEWSIRQFSQFNRISVPVTSAVPGCPTLILTYFTHPNNHDLLCCHINLTNLYCKEDDSFYVVYRQTVLSAERRHDATAEGSHLFEGQTTSELPHALLREINLSDRRHNTWVFPHVLKKGMLKEPDYGFLTNDTLNLRSEFVIYAHPSQPISEITSLNSLFRRMHLKAPLAIEDSTPSDISLRVGERVINAHRAVLSAHSPVFSAMFENDMKEKQTGVVVIEDINPDTVCQMLDMMYTGKMGGSSVEEVVDLLCAAHKYEAREVMDSCMSFLERVLSSENVVAILCLADVYHLAELKKSAVNFIYVQCREVLFSKEWNNLEKSNIKLAAEILCMMCKKRVEQEACTNMDYTS